MALDDLSFDIATLRAAYLAAAVTPEEVLAEARRRIGADDQHAWIHVESAEALQLRVAALRQRDPHALPLFGIPFAIKDNIDLEGVPTTAACPAFAQVPQGSADVVERLIEAGAIPVGKTNLDQFATGLNGTRSPYGACRNAFDGARVSGGSSSGSAVSVALGQVSFSLGTDTAGSGRVPAAFNHLVGLKPSLGLLSARGVVPACRTLDTISVFALTADDAHRVFAAALAYDASDAYARRAEPHGFDFGRAARFRLGVPKTGQLEFFGDTAYREAYATARMHAADLGADIVEIDVSPLLEAAALLYDGPWVAERYQAVRAFIESQPEALLPVTRGIIAGGKSPSAADAFAAQYRLRELKRACDAVWAEVDVMLTPTAPTHPTIEAMLAEPVGRNTELGFYTNFMNLLDYAAVAVPAGFTAAGLPFGVTLFGPAHQDVPLLHLASRWQRALRGRAATLGATGAALPRASVEPTPAVPSGQVRVAVCGAHLQGQPLNAQLAQRGARLVALTRTAPIYRFYALHGGPPQRPALVRAGAGEAGAAIEVEVWELPARHFGSFVAAIPAPLGIGSTVLEDGTTVPGFICETAGLAEARDITQHGGWRAFLASHAG